jgi:hypothetical protein
MTVTDDDYLTAVQSQRPRHAEPAGASTDNNNVYSSVHGFVVSVYV